MIHLEQFDRKRKIKAEIKEQTCSDLTMQNKKQFWFQNNLLFCLMVVEKSSQISKYLLNFSTHVDHAEEIFGLKTLTIEVQILK